MNPNASDGRLFGRRRTLEMLEAGLVPGRTIVLHGPTGAGKSAVLEALESRARVRGIAAGRAANARNVGDLTSALLAAHPGVDRSGGWPRVRARLREEAEKRRSLILLDHLENIGTAFKHLLFSLRGTRASVVLAADVDHPRDHARVRALGLSHQEIALAPLHPSSMRALLRALLRARALPHRLGPEDFWLLCRIARGLPGRAVWLADALGDPEAWRAGRIRGPWLLREALIATMGRAL
jgi:hypothetical protein